MNRNNTVIRGCLRWRVVRDGKVIREGVNHNIVTDEGDALIADAMSETPARTKVDNSNGRIQVGTGWTGTDPKQNVGVNVITGSAGSMVGGFPQLKTAWGGADDNVVQYRTIFGAGDLDATGIDEAALVNHATPGSADCLAYAQINPSVDVSTSDSLQVDWELTFTGS